MFLQQLCDCDVVKSYRKNCAFSQFLGISVVCGVSLWCYRWKKRHDLKKLATKTKHDETVALVQKLNELLQDKNVSYF